VQGIAFYIRFSALELIGGSNWPEIFYAAGAVWVQYGCSRALWGAEQDIALGAV
jgi:hypothetical protein